MGLDLNDHDEHVAPNPHSVALSDTIDVPFIASPLIWFKLILRTFKRRLPFGNPQ